MPFAEGRPRDRSSASPAPIRAYGRPVGVALDATGAPLAVDDVGDKAWRVVPAR